MDRTLFMGIDVGTYETKGVLSDVDGNIHSQVSKKHSMNIPRPGWAEHDAEKVWWGDFVYISNNLISQNNINPEQIASVAVSAIGPCMLPIDHNVNPLFSGVLYGVDTRAGKEISKLNKILGQENILKFGGNELTSQSIGPKILWLKDNHPEIFSKAFKIVSSTSYIVQKLTSECVIDHYTASNFTPLYNINTLSWDTSLAPNIVPIDKLPKIKWTTEIAGNTTKSASKETGLIQGTPVTTGTIDAAAEAVSVGLLDTGDLMIMYGSTMFFIALKANNYFDKRLWSSPWLYKGEYSYMAGTSTSGTVTQWFLKEFCSDLKSDSAFKKLTSMAEKSPIGSNGLLTLPYFSGERTPIQNLNAKGVLFGLNLTHSRADIYRSIIEGISYGASHIIETFCDVGIEPKNLFSVGGGVKNKIWSQSISDISGFNQIVRKKTIGASYGNSFLAALAINAVEKTDIIRWNPTDKIIFSKANSVHKKNYKNFKDLYNRTAELMNKI